MLTWALMLAGGAATAALDLGPLTQKHQAAVAGINCETLGSAYASVPSIVPFFSTLREMGTEPTKDEFETTTAFQERERKFWRDAFGEVGKVVLTKDINRNFIEYDADTLTVSVNFLIFAGRENLKGFYTLPIKVTESSSDYVGQNAFGATREVVHSNIQNASFIFSDGAFASDSVVADHWGATFKFQLGADEARAFKNGAKIVFLGKMAPPYLIRNQQRMRAKFSSGLSVSTNEAYFSVDPLCAAFIAQDRVVHTAMFNK